MRNWVKKTFTFAMGALIICLGLVYFFLFTSTGGCFVIRKAVLWFAKAERVDVWQARGSIITKMTLKDIQIQGPQSLPKGSIAVIRQAEIGLARFSKEGVRIAVEDGVLFMPQNNRINFAGSLKDSIIDVSIRSDFAIAEQILPLFHGVATSQTISGTLLDTGIIARGPLKRLLISGTFVADNFMYEGYIIKKALCKVVVIPETVNRTSSAKVFVALENADMGITEMPHVQANVQKVEIELDTRNISAMKIKVSNGRLSLPSSDPILFYGESTGELMNFNIYSKNVAINSLMPFFALEKPFASLRGSIEDVDLFLSGTMHEPVIKGTALIGKIDYQFFSLRNTPLAYDIVIKTKAPPAQINGVVNIKQGQVIGPSAVSVQLEESNVLFSGDHSKPSFNVKGSTSVEKTKIQIALKGTSDKPELKLSSEPPLPQEQLLVMLMTGKKWSGVKTVFSQGVISPDLAMDFIDYFLLGGSGSKIAGKFGITGFSVTLDKEKKGVEVKKSVTDKVEVGYEITQTQSQEKIPETTQKLSGELKVTDAISVGAEKELKQQNMSGETSEKQKTNDKVMIRFKKEF